MRNYIYAAALLFFLISNVLFGQTDNSNTSNKNAKDNFSLGNYKDALNDYLALIKNDSTNITYNFRIGVCYLYTDIDKSKAIYYLEKVIASPKADVNAWYEIGRAYMFDYNFDKAISCFKKYKSITNGKESFQLSSERMIQMCEEAKKQVKNPVNVTIENAGPEINSAYADYNPYIPSDESYMIFSSRRAGNTGNMQDFDGYNTADIYISYQKYGKWTKAKGIGNTINSGLVEESVGLSSDGSKLFVYADNYNAASTVMVSDKKGKTFGKPELLGNNINSLKLVTSATISTDKKMLVFACDKNEAEGGMDLYMCRKLPSGEWSTPENLGGKINTIYDEDFPYFAPDGKTLYFSSQGHNSMGGFDIFKTTYDKNTNTWSDPVNLGYPINTPDDDMTISFSATGRHAYIASLRKGGYGNLDIYKVIFNDADPAYMILSGTLMTKDSLNIFKIPEKKEIDSTKTTAVENKYTNNINPIYNAENKDTSVVKKEITYIKANAEITIIDKNTQKVFGKYLPNKTTGKFTLILPPGEFELSVKADGYEDRSETIKVFDEALNNEITKEIVLTYIVTGVTETEAKPN